MFPIENLKGRRPATSGDFIPMQRGNDRAVRERELPFPKGRYRKIVARLGAQLLKLASSTRQLLACQMLD
jgi:hypothetical protein